MSSRVASRTVTAPPGASSICAGTANCSRLKPALVCSSLRRRSGPRSLRPMVVPAIHSLARFQAELISTADRAALRLQLLNRRRSGVSDLADAQQRPALQAAIAPHGAPYFAGVKCIGEGAAQQ